MTTAANTHQQLTFTDARKPTGRGGWRPRAGRPRGRRQVAHTARTEFPSRVPLHITLRLAGGVPSLRREELVRLIRGQIAQSHRADFRIIHFSVQHNHIHLIIEASGRQALARGVQGLKVRLARRLNRALGRAGTFFDERYHARPLRTPREVRNAVRYVLNNERHHAFERGELLDPAWIDPFSSAPWFDGWATPLDARDDAVAFALTLPSPVAPPTVWLLTTGWKRHGLIATDEIPGAPQPTTTTSRDAVCRKAGRTRRTSRRQVGA